MENGKNKIGLRVASGFLVAITIIIAVFASGITIPGLENNPSLGSEQGRLTVLLKDAPVELDELIITITDVEVHRVGSEEGEDPIEGGWMTIVDNTEITFNLLDYQGDKTLTLGSVLIDPGTYNKIRMTVSYAEAVYSAESLELGYENGELNVPPGKIDVITNFELESAGTEIVTIDMEPDYVAISKSNNFRPTLTATNSVEID